MAGRQNSRLLIDPERSPPSGLPTPTLAVELRHSACGLRILRSITCTKTMDGFPSAAARQLFPPAGTVGKPQDSAATIHGIH
jgi:hypothetical protein